MVIWITLGIIFWPIALVAIPLWLILRSGRAASNGTRTRHSRDETAWSAGRRLPTARGEFVRSRGEVRVANWLWAHGYAYEYEPVICGFVPDFYIPDHGIVIEYWGLRDPAYLARRRLKTHVFLKNGYKLVSLEPGKAVSIEEDLRRQLYYKAVGAV